MLFFIALQALQITPWKVKIEYYNPKYIKFSNISIRKISRHSPYYINFEIETLDGAGNNVTVRKLNNIYCD